MKKIVTACCASAIACVIAFGAAGCGTDLNGKSFSSGEADATITAKLSGSLNISDNLFGIFLEDINYASYAMDANMVNNGNFESLGGDSRDYTASGWETEKAEFTVNSEDGVFADNAVYHNEDAGADVNPHYARVSVLDNDGGLVNAGHSQAAIYVRKGVQYKFSAFVRSPERAAKMRFSLVDGYGDEVLGTTVSVPQGDTWIKYERTVKSSKTTDDELEVRLLFDESGTYDVDAVRFETTDATVGVKNYIYRAIADLSPKFMRFPGGCIIEGDAGNGGNETKEVYDWKNSIGVAVTGGNAGDETVPAFTYQLDTNGKAKTVTTYGEWTTRTNNFDLWGYNMDYGLGFYEYFLLCEKIGATPVPIVNCGFSDQGGMASGAAVLLKGRHGNGVADYVQDALDLIEFANGDETTEWGRIRAAMGHPEPFHMKYIGVGNEQFTETYYRCYEQFLEAFRAAQKENPTAYGDVRPIVGSGMVFSDCEGAPEAGPKAYLAPNAISDYLSSKKIASASEYGIVDHHYYMGYVDFLHYATPENCIYDKPVYENNYKVFVGEFSANASTRYYGASNAYQTNSWYSAISEAAYMTALERNGDVVDLAAYAPMFGVCDGLKGASFPTNQWVVDMMYFTDSELLLSPNYYTQQLFMKNSGTNYLNAEMTVSDAVTPYATDGVNVDRLYQSVTLDKVSGDIIVKIVNAGDTDLKVNVEIAGASVKGAGNGTVITGKYGAQSMNTLDKDGYEVLPKNFTISASSKFGYTAPAFSVTAIRLHTK